MFFKASAAVLALATLASSSPIEDVKKGKTFTVEQVYNGQHLRRGAIEVLKTYNKFAVAAPAEVSSAAEAAAAASGVTGEDTATPEAYDSEYLCPVTIGTSGQTLNMDFDTGSADFWVFSSLMPSSESNGHVVYNPSSSSSEHQLSGDTWSITYGDGSGASGVVYADRVVIGGVTATSQAVEAATSVSSTFTADTQNDGLVGLAMSSINQVRPQAQSTFFDNVKSSLALPLFTATLKHNAPGTYDFGYIDSSKYTGSIAYAPVNTANGFWEFTATGYAIGSGGISGGNIDAIADTGTTLLFLPANVVRAYYRQVRGAGYYGPAGGYIAPCSSNWPNFSIVIGGQTRTVPGSYINFAPFEQGYCFGGIQSNAGIGFSILGDVFLKSQFVVFDSRGPQIGFAQQAGVSV